MRVLSFLISRMRYILSIMILDICDIKPRVRVVEYRNKVFVPFAEDNEYKLSIHFSHSLQWLFVSSHIFSLVSYPQRYVPNSYELFEILLNLLNLQLPSAIKFLFQPFVKLVPKNSKARIHWSSTCFINSYHTFPPPIIHQTLQHCW